MDTESTLSDIPDLFFQNYGERIVWALRKINRVMDVHSRQINRNHHITSPQMLCLLTLTRKGPQTPSSLAKIVNLSFSTLTGIVDRLEAKKLVLRKRSEQDRRKIFLHITEDGIRVTKTAPILLRDKLLIALSELSDLEQAAMALSLERLTELISPRDLPLDDFRFDQTIAEEEVK